MKFFKKLLSSNEAVSSKRFAALLSLLTLIVIIFLATFKDEKYIPPEFMYDALALIAASALGLSVTDKIMSKHLESKQPPNNESENENSPPI